MRNVSMPFDGAASYRDSIDLDKDSSYALTQRDIFLQIRLRLAAMAVAVALLLVHWMS